MANFIANFVQDLQKPLVPHYCESILLNDDNLSNEISVELLDNGEAATVSGSVVCKAIRADGGTVTFNGTLTGNTVSAILPAAAMAVTGRVGVLLQLVTGEVKTTVLKAVFTSDVGTTDTIIDPGSVVPDISDLLAMLDQMAEAIEDAEEATANANNAVEYVAPTETSPAAAAHAVGENLIYNGALYEVTAAIAVGDTLTVGTNIAAVPAGLGGEVADLKSAKVNTNQGVAQAGKALVVGQDGLVTTASAGISTTVKESLLDLVRHVAYIDDQGQTYYDALYAALYADVIPISIDATISQGYEPICNTDSLESVRKHITVKARFSDGVDVEVDGYTLSGALTAGTATITVQYMGKTDTVQVEVTQLPSGYTHRECVVADGTQAIPSGLYETDMQGLGIVFKEMRVDTVNRTGHILSAPNYYVPFLWSNGVDVQRINTLRYGTSPSDPSGVYWEPNQAYTIKAYMDGDKVEQDDAVRYEITAGTTMSASNQLIFLAYSGNGTEFPERFRFTGKLYYLKLFRGNTLVHSYIPCTNSSGVTGLYDAIDGRFLSPTFGTLAWE